jgi:hypothetical protein
MYKNNTQIILSAKVNYLLVLVKINSFEKYLDHTYMAKNLTTLHHVLSG